MGLKSDAEQWSEPHVLFHLNRLNDQHAPTVLSQDWLVNAGTTYTIFPYTHRVVRRLQLRLLQPHRATVCCPFGPLGCRWNPEIITHPECEVPN